MAPASNMTVLHLEPGHVLGAAAGGRRELTVAELTGGRFLAVRLPNSDARVEVPAELLTATSMPIDEDVLNRPLEYRVSDAVPALLFVGAPIDLAAIAPGKIAAPDGSPVMSIWQVGDEVEVGRSVLDAGKPDAADPAGATHQIVACSGEPLAYKV
jgi:hypothetical protein